MASGASFSPVLFLPAGPSPLLRIEHPVARAAGVRWYVKRDDLYALAPNDPYQGNKVRKLKGLLAQTGVSSLPLLTFGGAFSNHLGALASVGRRLGIRTIGIVRGEEAVRNPLLDFCRRSGMQLHFVSRSRYRQKNDPTELARWQATLGPAIVIPEGGSGSWASEGTADIVQETVAQLGYLPDFFQLSAGTAGTAAGVLRAFDCGASAQNEGNKRCPNTALQEEHGSCRLANTKQSRPPKPNTLQEGQQTKVELVAALKGNWMADALRSQLAGACCATPWEVLTNYHFGGYAKQTADLLDFCRQFTVQTQVPLEPIYTAKLFYAVHDRLSRGFYPPASTLVTYHSGGIYLL